MSWVILGVAAVLAGVAAAGVLRPFGRGRQSALDRRADPLEDERRSLLRALQDLDDERSTGQLSDQDYRALRSETEVRAVAVLRALEARDGAGELASQLKALRSPISGNGSGSGGGAAEAAQGDSAARPSPRDRRKRVIASFAIAAVVAAAVVPALAGAIRNRAPGQPITGLNVSGSAGPLAFFEQRVRDHPNDLAARLDLAQRYLDAGDPRSAITQYLAALQIDPRNPEAHAVLGFILLGAGKPQDGLKAEEQALQVDPNYPEALYYKGLILLRGLHQPAQAALAFRAYLAAAPYGSRRQDVQQLLAEAEAQSIPSG